MKTPAVKYGKGEVGRVRIVEDFLPSPDRLVLREDTSDDRLTGEQSEEVRRRRGDSNARKLTLDEFKERGAIKKQNERDELSSSTAGHQNLPFVPKVLRTGQPPPSRTRRFGS
jgi:hypothetical protein